MLAVVDNRIPSTAAAALSALGYEICALPPHPVLPAPVASHPDMLLFFAPDRILTTASYAAIADGQLARLSAQTHLPVVTVDAEHGERYPEDILLNAAPIGNTLFCHPTHTARELLTHPAYTPCPVRQGYAKCSILPVGRDALVTADAGIARAARERGMEALLIREGSVRLPGYPYGFLGGATSFAPYGGIGQILLCGSLALHPDGTHIEDFCRRHGRSLLSLGDFPPTDVGTIFLIPNT